MSRTKPLYRKKRNRFPAWLLLAVAGGVILIALGFQAFRSRNPQKPAEVSTGGAPRLQADQEKIDLGDVRLGEYVQVAFTLTNTGSQTLKIKQEPYIEVAEGC